MVFLTVWSLHNLSHPSITTRRLSNVYVRQEDFPGATQRRAGPYLDDARVFEHLGCHFVLLDDQALDSLQFLAVLEPLNRRLGLGLAANLRRETESSLGYLSIDS